MKRRIKTAKLILPARTKATNPNRRPIKYSLLPPLGLATLADYLDENAQIELVDEHVEAIGLDDAPDLVVIQVFITKAKPACRLTDHNRSRSSQVARGGLHVTALPKAILAPARAVNDEPDDAIAASHLSIRNFFPD